MSIKIGEIASRVVNRIRAGEPAFEPRSTPKITPAFPLGEIAKLANSNNRICVVARISHDNGVSFVDQYETDATDEAVLNIIDDILSSAEGAVDISLMAA